MKFRILEVLEGENKGKYEVFCYDEYDTRGAKWKKVIWDEKNYLQYLDYNFALTIDEAKFKAKEYFEKWQNKHGKLVEEFEL